MPVFGSPKFSVGILVNHCFYADSALSLRLFASTGKPQLQIVLRLGDQAVFLLGGRSGAIDDSLFGLRFT